MDGAEQPNGTQVTWQYNSNDVPPAVQPPTSSPQVDEAVSWTASEFIAHHKTSGWYAMLAFGTIIAAAFAYWISDGVSAFFIVFAAITFGVYAGRSPREMMYQLDPGGLTVGQKFYPYAGFRSFSIDQEGAFSSVVFTPLKRFAPLTTIYYDPKDEDVITSLISRHLPFEQRKRDMIDRLMWRVRF